MAEPITRGEMDELLEKVPNYIRLLDGFCTTKTMDIVRAIRSLLLEPDHQRCVMFRCIDCGRLSFKLGLCECHKKPDRRESRDALAVPRSFVEFCIRKSDSEEHKSRLRMLLKFDGQDAPLRPSNAEIVEGFKELAQDARRITAKVRQELGITDEEFDALLTVQDKDMTFINHVAGHLKPGEEVVCKICGKSAKQIIEEEKKDE